MNFALLPTYALKFLILFPSIILHEVAHGYVAYRLGDPTAKRAGRLTLNPIAHVDLVGTILLPALLIVTTGGFIGWAKPVPFNPAYFKNKRTGELLVGIAGPATNLALAVVFGLVIRLVPIPEGGATIGVVSSLWSALAYVAWANLGLLFFNLVPIPPLDGSRVLQHVLPEGMRRSYQALDRYGFLILFALLYVVPSFWTAYMGLTAVPLFQLITGLTFG